MNRSATAFVLPILLVATLAVALFGFSLMSGQEGVMVGCFGNGADCSLLGPIAHFEMHLNAFRSVSTAIASVAGFLILLLFLGNQYFSRKIRIDDDAGRKGVCAYAIGFFPPFIAPLVSWIALHEKRDPSFAYAIGMK